jgi:hypothetical protein
MPAVVSVSSWIGRVPLVMFLTTEQALACT